MMLCLSKVKVHGLENLPPIDEPVVYVPNHTSFLDILVLSAFIPRPFKYLSKAEILKTPLVGWGMQLAKHVFLKRNDMRSTLECAELCVERVRYCTYYDLNHHQSSILD
jgi:1-acyl-sn-glycerol-3-phosphate acyltransferase